MARVFVSHASQDRLLASDLRGWLVDDGHDVFLDQDLRDGIAVGEEWEQRLYERLRWADAVICVLTSSYEESAWCSAEVGIARSQGSRLLPVREEKGATHPLLGSSQYQYADMEDPAAARAALSEALRRLDAAGGWGWPAGRSPFPGLRPFETDLHRVFFGRHAEVESLASLLRSPAGGSDSGGLLVVGPSGCGKSSLVRAGLLPVMALEPGWRTLPPVVPGADPMAALARELAHAAQPLGLRWTVRHVREQLNRDDGLTALADEMLLADAGPGRRLLVVVDQLEELLTLTPGTARNQFARLLGRSVAGPVRVVATLRPEFLGQLLADLDLADMPARTFTLRPLRHDSLAEVIEGPARVAGIEVDPDLVARLVGDTDTGEALPLLAFTLARLAEDVGRGRRLSASRYDQLGTVQGALVRQADAALADAVGIGGRTREKVISGLLRLVAVDEQDHPIRWRVNQDELPIPVRAELGAFVARRLLSTDSVDGTVVLGVTHEAFLSAWPPLAAAIASAAAALRARRTLEHAAAEWDDAGRPSSGLFEHGRLAAVVAATGARLTSAAGRVDNEVSTSVPPAPTRLVTLLPHRRRVLATDNVDLSPPARDFLRLSLRASHRAHRRSQALYGVLALLAACVIAAASALAYDPIHDAILRHRAQQLGPQALVNGGFAGVDRDAKAHSAVYRRVLVRSFYLDVHEVTNAQYQICVDARECTLPSEPANHRFFSEGDPDEPVVNVNAYQAADFCAWIDRRLPTAEEWSRAVSSRRAMVEDQVFGREHTSLDHFGNLDFGPRRTSLLPVESPEFSAGRTDEGISDLFGNAREWVATEIVGPNEKKPELRDWNQHELVPDLLLMGGSYREQPHLVFYPYAANPDSAGTNEFGIRCARTK